jgi:FAD/FMN-containing dehydrogenase/Fe-S oxidoreductase
MPFNQLKERFAFLGEVDSSLGARQRYATDASIYEQLPSCVVFPTCHNDLVALVRFANQFQRKITLRGGGTSLAGQAIGNDIIADISRHMNRILSLDLAKRQVRVEAGVVLDDLNRFLKPHGLWLAIDTSTANRCVIGGVVANNSCGAYSLAYQTPRQQVVAVTAVLSDASSCVFEPLSTEMVQEKKTQTNLEGDIYRCIDAMIFENKQAILTAFPDPSIIRRNTGYALDALALQSHWHSRDSEDTQANLSQLICGSEGTLVLMSDVVFQLQPLPLSRGLLVVHFNDVFLALDATAVLLKTAPVAIELIDAPTMAGTKGHAGFQKHRFWIDGEPEAVLVIEYFAETEAQLDVMLKKGIALANGLAGVYASVPVTGANMASVWEVRKAGLGLLMGKVSDKKAIAVIEDTAVPVVHLSAFMRDIRALMASLSVNCIYYGHASVGLIHLRPELDLSQPSDKVLFTKIAAQVSLLVKQYKGALSGEHGDGRLRAPFLNEQFGDAVYKLLVSVKQVFDPNNRFNPDRIIGNLPIDSDWRIPVSSATLVTGFDWQQDGGFAKSVEKCNGAGACRKSTGAMCPSYQVTRDDRFATRGRANLLRFALQSPEPVTTMSETALQEALSLCLSCKACKSECPASVDMSRLKSEVLFQTRKNNRLTFKARLLRHYAAMLPWLNRARYLIPLLDRVRWLFSPFGWDSRRHFPLPDGKDLLNWWEDTGKNNNNATGKLVVVLVDVYSRYLHTESGKSTIVVLQQLGFNVQPIWLTDSPRLLISSGFLNEARVVLSQLVNALVAQVDQEKLWGIVGIEPSELLVLRDDALALLAPHDQTALATYQNRIWLFEEAMLAFAKTHTDYIWKKANQPVTIHVHCHQKSLVGTELTKQAFALLQAPVTIIDAGCCGMAGSFGYEHTDISLKIAQQVLLPSIADLAEDVSLVSSGTSCQQQVFDFAQRKAIHPAVLFANVMTR